MPGHGCPCDALAADDGGAGVVVYHPLTELPLYPTARASASRSGLVAQISDPGLGQFVGDGGVHCGFLGERSWAIS
jgi:hypothetical protein